jgi:ATP-binding cassette subfamily B protein
MFSTNSSFPHLRQRDAMDCGPTCLKMIAQFYGKNYPLTYLRKQCYIDRQGVSLSGIAVAAEKIGMHTLAVKTTLTELIAEDVTPFIAHWQQNHFVVVHKITNNKVYVADPGAGKLVYTHAEFEKAWAKDRNEPTPKGISLLLEPTPHFGKDLEEVEEETGAVNSLWFLAGYLKPYKALLFQLFLSLLTATLLSLLMPMLTQSLVDSGINQQNLNFVYVVLIAQLCFFFGRSAIQIIRSWLLMHISTRMNIKLIADFLAKMMRLPMPFFDSKNLGDILQRIRDNSRIEQFLTSSSLDFVFSMVSLSVVSVVMLFYNAPIFLMFVISSTIYVGYVTLFLKKRRELDAKRFALSASNQSNEVQLVQGMTEIKLNNCEQQKRWEWEKLQVKKFKLGMEGLRMQQWQSFGSSFIYELKSILIAFWAAKEVIEGNMTLGMMMATQQILGQLDAPIMQFVGFMQQAQDAKMSLERLGEIHQEKDEDQSPTPDLSPTGRGEFFSFSAGEGGRGLRLENLSFRYGDPTTDYVLKDLNLTIPEGKTTAIVGESGSGKTTLIKLLLKFYPIEKGEILVGNTPLNLIKSSQWRSKIGTLMQEGFIFSDTIAQNIALSDEEIDNERLVKAAKIANIHDFITSLPLGYHTKIGGEGVGVSGGQRQRILIARAVYKNPDYLFFDEATSALDANNEKIIMENLQQFFENRTVIIIAHRLSTVKNADQIVVLEKGEMVEIGNHETLVAKRGKYFELVRNQLELGE